MYYMCNISQKRQHMSGSANTYKHFRMPIDTSGLGLREQGLGSANTYKHFRMPIDTSGLGLRVQALGFSERKHVQTFANAYRYTRTVSVQRFGFFFFLGFMRTQICVHTYKHVRVRPHARATLGACSCVRRQAAEHGGKTKRRCPYAHIAHKKKCA